MRRIALFFLLFLTMATVFYSPVVAEESVEQIFISYSYGRSTTLEYQPSTTIENYKQMVLDREPYIESLDDLLLMDFYGVLYEDQSTSEDNNIKDGQTLYAGLVPRLTTVIGTDGNVIGDFNLQPHGSLSGENLAGVNLYEHQFLMGADLTFANLTNAKFGMILSTDYSRGVRLYNANLSGANLTRADLSYAELSYAELSDANLSGADFSDIGSYKYTNWDDAFYYTDNEPTWAAGMDAAWRSSVGILAIAPVPEPAAILLALVGLALLPRRSRQIGA